MTQSVKGGLVRLLSMSPHEGETVIAWRTEVSLEMTSEGGGHRPLLQSGLTQVLKAAVPFLVRPRP